jgi:hypothetical protein
MSSPTHTQFFMTVKYKRAVEIWADGFQADDPLSLGQRETNNLNQTIS